MAPFDTRTDSDHVVSHYHVLHLFLSRVRDRTGQLGAACLFIIDFSACAGCRECDNAMKADRPLIAPRRTWYILLIDDKLD
jgi:hypothetical protein